ncbi:hypothetical protein HK101_010200 [Irineochytrium annulatum]|nr:hypothetical protein HK101_010200 [Irineochytrium annulatum]
MPKAKKQKTAAAASEAVPVDEPTVAEPEENKEEENDDKDYEEEDEGPGLTEEQQTKLDEIDKEIEVRSPQELAGRVAGFSVFMRAMSSKLDDELEKKKKDLEIQFFKKLKPLFDKRDKVVADVPKFWYRVMKHTQFTEDEDLPILEHLTGVKVEKAAKSQKITFTFAKNEYFSDTKLHHEVIFGDDDEKTIKGATIHWAAGKNPMEKTSKKRKADADEEQEEGEEITFFQWLTNAEPPLDPETAEGVSSTFVDEIYPDAVKVFEGHRDLGMFDLLEGGEEEEGDGGDGDE